jgi:hypothetical protein
MFVIVVDRLAVHDATPGVGSADSGAGDTVGGAEQKFTSAAIVHPNAAIVVAEVAADLARRAAVLSHIDEAHAAQIRRAFLATIFVGGALDYALIR